MQLNCMEGAAWAGALRACDAQTRGQLACHSRQRSPSCAPRVNLHTSPTVSHATASQRTTLWHEMYLEVMSTRGHVSTTLKIVYTVDNCPAWLHQAVNVWSCSAAEGMHEMLSTVCMLAAHAHQIVDTASETAATSAPHAVRTVVHCARCNGRADTICAIAYTVYQQKERH